MPSGHDVMRPTFEGLDVELKLYLRLFWQPKVFISANK